MPSCKKCYMSIWMGAMSVAVVAAGAAAVYFIAIRG